MELSELGRTPVPGPSPAGEEARYEPAYMDLLTEIDKLSALTQTGEVNWKKVVDLGAAILSEKSKDLAAAAYMAVGLTEIRGCEGLALGAGILRDLAENFWETCFPPKKRMRGRVNAFLWWQEKTLGQIRSFSGPPVKSETHRGLLEKVRGLDRILGEHAPELPPMAELIKILQALPVEPDQAPPPPAAAPVEDSAPETTATPQPSPRPAPAAPESAPPEDLASSRKQLMENALSFAGMTRKASPQDPWAFKAARMAAWLRIQNPPPSDKDLTALPAPDPTVKSALLTLLGDGRFLEVVNGVEDYFTAAIFWLDLQRISAQALEGLGSEWRAALYAVETDTALLLRRLPGLARLAFSDGTPFADPQTRDWLTGLTAPSEERQAPSAKGDPLQDILKEARALFAKKEEAAALDALSLAISQAADGLTRMRLRLAQTDLLCRSGRFALAAALADSLLAETGSRDLVSWDPSLAEQIFTAGYRAFSGLNDAPHLQKAEDLAIRLCRLRPAAALALLP